MYADSNCFENKILLAPCVSLGLFSSPNEPHADAWGFTIGTDLRVELTNTRALFTFICGTDGDIFAFAQDKAPEIVSRDTPTTFSSKVNLVMVPVVVRDSKGKAIGTLKKEDFQLFDKGKPQTISRFAIEKSDGRVVPLEVTAEDVARKKPRRGLRRRAGLPPTCSMTCTQRSGIWRRRARRRSSIWKSTLKGADRVADFTTSGQNALDFTDDREKLAETMNRIMPRSRMTRSGTECPDISDYQADLIINKNDASATTAAAAEVIACGQATTMSVATTVAQAAASRVLSITDADTQIALQMLKSSVQRMAAMPGQRTIVLVSPGFLVTQNHRQDEIDVIDRAIRANVTISTSGCARALRI